MRVEDDRGVLLYWPPHEGVLYCTAGPVSWNVAVRIIGTEEEISKAMTTPRLFGCRYSPPKLRLAPDYRVTASVGVVVEHSTPIPEDGGVIVRVRT